MTPASKFIARYGLAKSEARTLRDSIRGLSNREIAELRGIEHSTVVTHWRRLCAKAGCKTRHEVLAMILRMR